MLTDLEGKLLSLVKISLLRSSEKTTRLNFHKCLTSLTKLLQKKILKLQSMSTSISNKRTKLKCWNGQQSNVSLKNQI